MKDVQEELMEDYSINPAVVAHCDIEIRNYCGRVEKGGKTLDCLMEKAMEKEEPKSQVKFSKECYDAVSIEFSIGDFPRVARAWFFRVTAELLVGSTQSKQWQIELLYAALKNNEYLINKLSEFTNL